jgi:hypothetical protein
LMQKVYGENFNVFNFIPVPTFSWFLCS